MVGGIIGSRCRTRRQWEKEFHNGLRSDVACWKLRDLVMMSTPNSLSKLNACMNFFESIGQIYL